MRFTLVLAAGLVTGVLAAPVQRRQLAGEGAACNSVLSSTDNGVGYGVENAEDNIANTIKGSGAKVRRQLAGEGAACNSVLSSTDNGVGYGVENAEDNIANTIKSSGVKSRRQLDKIANGAKNIGDAVGAVSVTTPVGDDGDTLDGQLTGGTWNEHNPYLRNPILYDISLRHR